MRARLIAVLATVLFAGGCSFNEKFPAKWPVPTGGGCAALSGVYSNFGEFGELHVVARPGTDLRPRLARRFFLAEPEVRDQWVELERADRVVLRYDGGVLSVDVRNGGTSVRTAEFSLQAKTLKCTREGAVIAGFSGWSHGAGNPNIGVESNYDTLMPATDGSLIVRYSGSTTGLVYGVYPFSATSASWLHWPRLDR